MTRTPEQKEALQKAIDWLAAGAPHVQITPDLALDRFHFGNWIAPSYYGDCGTIACIAGAVIEFNEPDLAIEYIAAGDTDVEIEAMRLAGLTKGESEVLFYPFETDRLQGHYWTRDLPPEKVAVVVQHFQDTGEINWEMAR